MSKVPDSLTSFQMLAASLIDSERISKGGWCFEIADFPFLALFGSWYRKVWKRVCLK